MIETRYMCEIMQLLEDNQQRVCALLVWLRRITILVYGTTFLLGLGIKLRWWHTRGIRWIHHSLFAGIWVSTIATTLSGSMCRIRAWFAPLAVLIWMAPLPRFRAGGRMHEVLATSGLVTLLVAMGVSQIKKREEESRFGFL